VVLDGWLHSGRQRTIYNLMQTLLVYCRVSYGAGHWVRTAALMAALARRFRVVLALRGTLSEDLAVPAEVEIVTLPEQASGSTAPLIELTDKERPIAVMIEYFPFGRQDASDEIVPLLEFIRGRFHPAPFVVCSLRDVQQCRRRQQQEFDARVCELVNRYFDAVLVHADPQLFSLHMTFAQVDALRVPVFHTGYVVPENEAPPWSPEAEPPRIVVSAGGGRGGEELLRIAVEAQQKTDLANDFAMRVIAGTYLDAASWNSLQCAARDVPRFEVIRWVSDLPRELAKASVSVSRCGYNTALDILRTRVPALVVPFATPTEDEQTRRAMKLARLGAVRWMTQERTNHETLAAEIRRTADFRPQPIHLDLDGAERSAQLIANELRNVRAC
jgi:predicted glycosyltransferase